MKHLDQIITAPEGTSSSEAFQIMQVKKVKKLPVVSASGELKGNCFSTSSTMQLMLKGHPVYRHVRLGRP